METIYIYKSTDFLFGFTGCDSDNYETAEEALLDAVNYYGYGVLYAFNV